MEDPDPVAAHVARTFSPMLSLHGFLGCLLTRYTPLADGLDAIFAIGPLPSEPAMLEARVIVRQEAAVVVQLFRSGDEIATVSTGVTLASLADDVEPMVELNAGVLGHLIHQLSEDERPAALAHVRAVYADGLKPLAGLPLSGLKKPG